MKIISYNINLCTQAKLDELFKQNANVYVIPEMANDVKIPDGYFMKWYGKYPSKGMGIIYNNGSIPECFDESLSYAIPLQYKNFFILAFWPAKIEKSESYTQIAKKILNHYASELKSDKTIITGDFNLYHKKDKPNKDADLLEFDKLLKDYGLKSIHHTKTGEAFGEEKENTYYHQFKKDNPFFLDYTYANFEVIKYELMDWDPKFSDHRGQIIEF